MPGGGGGGCRRIRVGPRPRSHSEPTLEEHGASRIATGGRRAELAGPGAQNNQLSRAKDNKPFQCRDGRNSQLRRRLAARVKKGIFRNFAKFKLTARDSRTRIVFWLSYVTASGVKLYLCGHGKGRRDRYPQNILCECPMLRLRRPGPWPGAEAVTAELSCHGRVMSYHISWSQYRTTRPKWAKQSVQQLAHEPCLQQQQPLPQPQAEPPRAIDATFR